MRTLLRRLAAERSGQSLLELAMVFPMFLLLALGVVEVGNALFDQHVVTKMSREGANLISRDTTIADAAKVIRDMSGGRLTAPADGKLIFSVLKRGATTGTANYDKIILYQRYEWGSLPKSSTLRTRGAGSFGAAPNYEAASSDTNTGLQVTNVPANLVATKGAMVYITEIYTRRDLLTPIDRIGIPVPTVLYSIAYF
jgi:hypothetical protein